MVGLVNHFKTGWYVLYTKPRHEKTIAQELADLQLNYFLPMVKKLSVWHDRRKFIDSPLFPSYIFMHLRDMHDYFGCLNVKGVLSYVRFGKEVAQVKDDVINNIRLIVNGGNEIDVSDAQFSPGQQLVISKGPLTGLSGEMVKYNDKQKLLIRIQLLQRNPLVTMPADYLMPEYVKNSIYNGH